MDIYESVESGGMPLQSYLIIHKEAALSEDDKDATYICCKNEDVHVYGGRDYCYNLSDKKICKTDDMCISGACGRLGTDSSVSGNAYCCPSGETTYHGVSAHDFCTGQKSGTECYMDAQCASNFCSGGDGGWKKGKCLEIGDVGSE